MKQTLTSYNALYSLSSGSGSVFCCINSFLWCYNKIILASKYFFIRTSFGTHNSSVYSDRVSEKTGYNEINFIHFLL